MTSQAWKDALGAATAKPALRYRALGDGVRCTWSVGEGAFDTPHRFLPQTPLVVRIPGHAAAEVAFGPQSVAEFGPYRVSWHAQGSAAPFPELECVPALPPGSMLEFGLDYAPIDPETSRKTWYARLQPVVPGQKVWPVLHPARYALVGVWADGISVYRGNDPHPVQVFEPADYVVTVNQGVGLVQLPRPLEPDESALVGFIVDELLVVATPAPAPQMAAPVDHAGDEIDVTSHGDDPLVKLTADFAQAQAALDSMNKAIGSVLGAVAGPLGQVVGSTIGALHGRMRELDDAEKILQPTAPKPAQKRKPGPVSDRLARRRGRIILEDDDGE